MGLPSGILNPKLLSDHAKQPAPTGRDWCPISIWLVRGRLVHAAGELRAKLAIRERTEFELADERQ